MPDMPSLTLSLSPAIITLCSLCRCVGKEFGDGIGLVGQSGYSRPRRAPLEPKLGRWVFPARAVEALQPAISGTIARARPLVPAHQTKAYLLVHTKIGAHASEDAVARSQMRPDLCRRWPARQPKQQYRGVMMQQRGRFQKALLGLQPDQRASGSD